MGGLNRGRHVVQVGDAWRLYQAVPLHGWEMLGVIERNGERGALARSPAGLYAMVNAGAVRALDQRKVAAALAASAGIIL